MRKDQAQCPQEYSSWFKPWTWGQRSVTTLGVEAEELVFGFGDALYAIPSRNGPDEGADGYLDMSPDAETFSKHTGHLAKTWKAGKGGALVLRGAAELADESRVTDVDVPAPPPRSRSRVGDSPEGSLSTDSGNKSETEKETLSFNVEFYDKTVVEQGANSLYIKMLLELLSMTKLDVTVTTPEQLGAFLKKYVAVSTNPEPDLFEAITPQLYGNYPDFIGKFREAMSVSARAPLSADAVKDFILYFAVMGVKVTVKGHPEFAAPTYETLQSVRKKVGLLPSPRLISDPGYGVMSAPANGIKETSLVGDAPVYEAIVERLTALTRAIDNPAYAEGSLAAQRPLPAKQGASKPDHPPESAIYDVATAQNPVEGQAVYEMASFTKGSGNSNSVDDEAVYDRANPNGVTTDPDEPELEGNELYGFGMSPASSEEDIYKIDGMGDDDQYAISTMNLHAGIATDEQLYEQAVANSGPYTMPRKKKPADMTGVKVVMVDGEPQYLVPRAADEGVYAVPVATDTASISRQSSDADVTVLYKVEIHTPLEMGTKEQAVMEQVLALIKSMAMPPKAKMSTRTKVAIAALATTALIALVVGFIAKSSGDDDCDEPAELTALQGECKAALAELISRSPGSPMAVTGVVLRAVYNTLSASGVMFEGALALAYNQETFLTHLKDQCTAAVYDVLCVSEEYAGLEGLDVTDIVAPSITIPDVEFACPAKTVGQRTLIPAADYLATVTRGTAESIIFSEMQGARLLLNSAVVAPVNGQYTVPAASAGNYQIQVIGLGAVTFDVHHTAIPSAGGTAFASQTETCQVQSNAAIPAYSVMTQTGSVSASGRVNQDIRFSTMFTMDVLLGTSLSGRLLRGIPADAIVKLTNGNVVPVSAERTALLPVSGQFIVRMSQAGTYDDMSVVPCVNYGGDAPHCYSSAQATALNMVVNPTATAGSTPVTPIVTPGVTTPLATTPLPTASAQPSSTIFTTVTVLQPVVNFTCPAVSVPETSDVSLAAFTNRVSVTDGAVARYIFTLNGMTMRHGATQAQVTPNAQGQYIIAAADASQYRLRSLGYGTKSLALHVDVTASNGAIVSTSPVTCEASFSAVPPVFSTITQTGNLIGSGTQGDNVLFNTGFTVPSPDALTGRFLAGLASGTQVLLADGSTVTASIDGAGTVTLPATGDFFVPFASAGTQTFTIAPIVAYGGAAPHVYSSDALTIEANIAATTTTTTPTTTLPAPSLGFSCPSVAINEGARQAFTAYTNAFSTSNVRSVDSYLLTLRNGAVLYRSGAAQSGSSHTILEADKAQYSLGMAAFAYGTPAVDIRTRVTSLQGQTVTSAEHSCSYAVNPVRSPISFSGTTSYSGLTNTWLTVSGAVSKEAGESLSSIQITNLGGVQTRNTATSPNGQFSFQVMHTSAGTFSPRVTACIDYDGAGSRTPECVTSPVRGMSLLFEAPTTTSAPGTCCFRGACRPC